MDNGFLKVKRSILVKLKQLLLPFVPNFLRHLVGLNGKHWKRTISDFCHSGFTDSRDREWDLSRKFSFRIRMRVLGKNWDWEWYYQISVNELNWESRLRVDFFITFEGLKSFFEGSLRVGMKNEIYQGNFHQEQEWHFWGEIEIE